MFGSRWPWKKWGADWSGLLTTYSMWAVRVSWSRTAARHSSGKDSTEGGGLLVSHLCENWNSIRLTPFYKSARKWQALCQCSWSSTVRSKTTTQNWMWPLFFFLFFFNRCSHNQYDPGIQTQTSLVCACTILVSVRPRDFLGFCCRWVQLCLPLSMYFF